MFRLFDLILVFLERVFGLSRASGVPTIGQT